MDVYDEVDRRENETSEFRPNKLPFLVLVSIPLKKWRCGAKFFVVV